MKGIILFDFDGTLTIRDTTRYLFLVLLKNNPLGFFFIVFKLLKLVFFRYHLEYFQSIKYQILSELMSDLSLDKLTKLLCQFQTKVKPLLRKGAIERVKLYQKQGAIVIVVTASPRLAVEAALAHIGLPVIGTEFGIIDNRLTKELLTPCCFGSAKVSAIARWRDNSNAHLPIIEAWSDSLCDLPMMALADRRVWITSSKNAEKFREQDQHAAILDGNLRPIPIEPHTTE